MSESQKKSSNHFRMIAECCEKIEKRNRAVINADAELENFFLDYPEMYDELCEQYDINEIIPNFEHTPF